jgi:Tol biopolymer transport system component
MPDDTDFDRDLAQRLRLYESRIAGAEPPDPQAPHVAGQRRLSLIGLGLVAAVALAAVMLSRAGDDTGLPSPSIQPSASAVAPTSSPGPSATSPEATASPVQSASPDDLAVGTLLRVQVNGLRMRAEPSTTGNPLATLPGGAIVTVLGGPTTADGQDWYEVGRGDAQGWVAVGEDRDWLAVLANGRIGFWCLGCEADRSGAYMTVDVDGSDARIEDDTRAIAAWSPDGSQVAMAIGGTSDTPSRVELRGADGTLLRDLGSGYRATWSPDGSRLAFVNPTDGTIQLLEGDRQVGLTVTDHGAPLDLRWSPDGRRLAFTAYDCPACAAGEPAAPEAPIGIFVFDPPGGAVDLLAVGSLPVMLDWSADGSMITFGEVNPDTGVTDAHQVDVATGDVHELDWAEAGLGYAVSPDGLRVAFGTQDGIVVANADGTGLTTLVPMEPATALQPANPRWSPDGRWILYDLLAIQGDAVFPAVIRTDGSDQHTLVEHDGYDASWQPILIPLPGR